MGRDMSDGTGTVKWTCAPATHQTLARYARARPAFAACSGERADSGKPDPSCWVRTPDKRAGTESEAIGSGLGPPLALSGWCSWWTSRGRVSRTESSGRDPTTNTAGCRAAPAAPPPVAAAAAAAAAAAGWCGWATSGAWAMVASRDKWPRWLAERSGRKPVTQSIANCYKPQHVARGPSSPKL